MSDGLERYRCQIALPGFGAAAQSRLSKSSVLVIGAGGLGCPTLQYLAAAGVGRIGLADDDLVCTSNLHRQVLFTPADTGQPKVLVATKWLQRQNPEIEVIPHQVRVNPANVMSLLSSYDLIIEGTDNFDTKYLINDACVLLGKALVYGAIYQYEGQVSIWNVLQGDGSYTPNYRDVFNDADKAAVPNCAEGGVMPTIAGIIGCLQATQAIKYLTGAAGLLAGKLLLLNIHDLTMQTIALKKNPDLQITRLPHCVEAITWEAFEAMNRESAISLLDVRSVKERCAYHLGGIHIPLGELPDRLSALPIEAPILCYCHSGSRSLVAAKMVQSRFPKARIYMLKGGSEKMKAASS